LRNNKLNPSASRHMSVVKSLWASVQGDPVIMRRLNGWLTIFWIAMIPVSITLGLLSSVTYVAALSLWALVSGHWSAWQAARVEVEQMAEAQELQDNPVEMRVVEKIIEDTNLAPAPSNSTNQATPSATHDVSTPTVQQRLAQITEQLTDLHRDLESQSVAQS
jgi:hypothetical protein